MDSASETHSQPTSTSNKLALFHFCAPEACLNVICKQLASHLNVLAYLLLERVQRREFPLIAQLLDKRRFDLLSIQVARKIEQVGFHAQFRSRILQGRPVADV